MKKKNKAAISLCDKSGIMMKPWAENGYTCYCVDLQHKQRSDRVEVFEGGGKIIFTWGDARSWVPPDDVEVVFVAAFPVCTNMAGSGARDFVKKGIPMLMDGLILFNACYQVAKWSGAPFCIENPSGAITSHHRKPDYTFHPWYYGNMYQKLTCLWTGNGFVMPEREYISKPAEVTQKIWLMPPGADRQDKRSETPEGFARAIYEANTHTIKQ